jgi:hypothetical protein
MLHGDAICESGRERRVIAAVVTGAIILAMYVS